jgi:hypothetical protein
MYRPTTMLCIKIDFEKQMVRRARRLMRVLKVRCLHSIFQVMSLPTTCSLPRGLRAYAPPIVGVEALDPEGLQQGLQLLVDLVLAAAKT